MPKPTGSLAADRTHYAVGSTSDAPCRASSPSRVRRWLVAALATGVLFWACSTNTSDENKLGAADPDAGDATAESAHDAAAEGHDDVNLDAAEDSADGDGRGADAALDVASEDSGDGAVGDGDSGGESGVPLCQGVPNRIGTCLRYASPIPSGGLSLSGMVTAVDTAPTFKCAFPTQTDGYVQALGLGVPSAPAVGLTIQAGAEVLELILAAPNLNTQQFSTGQTLTVNLDLAPTEYSWGSMVELQDSTGLIVAMMEALAAPGFSVAPGAVECQDDCTTPRVAATVTYDGATVEVPSQAQVDIGPLTVFNERYRREETFLGTPPQNAACFAEGQEERFRLAVQRRSQ